MMRNVEQFRVIQADAVARMSLAPPTGGGAPAPEVVALLIAAVGRALAMEDKIGISAGHEATRQFVENLIRLLEQNHVAASTMTACPQVEEPPRS